MSGSKGSPSFSATPYRQTICSNLLNCSPQARNWTNAVLEREIKHLLTRPVGRPSHKPKVFYHSFQYQAKSWQRARRVVAKIEWHVRELFPASGSS